MYRQYLLCCPKTQNPVRISQPPIASATNGAVSNPPPSVQPKVPPFTSINSLMSITSVEDEELPESIGKDIMISYSHQDAKFMNRLKDSLTDYGFSVWVDKEGLRGGDNFLDKIGQAIIDSKIFLPIVSVEQVKSKYCIGEMAMAYISDKAIFPVELQTSKVVFPLMPTGMRLQLAEFNWISFHDGGQLTNEKYDEGFPQLLQLIKEELAKQNEQDPDQLMSERQITKKTLRQKNDDTLVGASDSVRFWADNFGEESAVPWSKFSEVFLEKFVSQLYNEEEKKDILVMLRREFAIGDGDMMKEKFDEFVTLDNKVVPFFRRVQLFATESLAVREVFDMDSELRIDAINNLGKYKSQAVVEGLMDLLEDHDPNVRAVALMSLAKTGQNTDRVVNRMFINLDDKDRLVRESACLALGRLKVKGDVVVKKIVHIWRNDVIASVRECAELALQQLDSEEARTAVHMTQLLKKEIQMLRE